MNGRVLPFPGGRQSTGAEPTQPDPSGSSVGAPITRKPPKPRTPKAPPTPIAPARPPHVFSSEERALQQKMLAAYFDGRRPARNHAASSIKTDRSAVSDLLDFIQQRGPARAAGVRHGHRLARRADLRIPGPLPTRGRFCEKTSGRGTKNRAQGRTSLSTGSWAEHLLAVSAYSRLQPRRLPCAKYLTPTLAKS